MPLYIPEDIIHHILSRVPEVKTLVRLSCVCKLWHQIITSDKVFIKAHLRNQSTRNVLFRHVENKTEERKGYFWTWRCDHNRERFIKVDDETIIASNMGDLTKSTELVGCCDGVFCFARYRDVENDWEVCLWNPALRQYKILPMTVDKVYHPVAIGFGFDVTSNDYKVVKVYSTYKEEEEKEDKKKSMYINVDVYSLNTHCWRTINTRPITIEQPWIPLREKGLIHKGCFYWKSRSSDGCKNIYNEDREVIYLHKVDLSIQENGENNFGTYVLPDCIDSVQFHHLTNFEGYLSICAYANSEFHLWSMMKGTQPNEWKKQLIGKPAGLGQYRFVALNSKMLTYQFSESSEASLVLYDCERKVIDEKLPGGVIHHLSELYDWSYSVADNYVESLVSVIPPRTERHKNHLRTLVFGSLPIVLFLSKHFVSHSLKS
ncbi:OLC1v1009255C1 [Oldenlandia corymbosa var. corymbosa]|uniref:OLC1v1009255C1 n=1 Tax=Oldenlandia corymbosa var. corymbosa TaxID=529605 RepID=A0AAV1DNR0_OLDCO|nr:OLC1v1009255C1 [Oldenlandia corymbosa var. corymbosa]